MESPQSLIKVEFCASGRTFQKPDFSILVHSPILILNLSNFEPSAHHQGLQKPVINLYIYSLCFEQPTYHHQGRKISYRVRKRLKVAWNVLETTGMSVALN